MKNFTDWCYFWHKHAVVFTLFVPFAAILGCSTSVNSSGNQSAIVLKPAQQVVYAGAATPVSATLDGIPLSAGTWDVAGGSVNGRIDSSGIYHAPLAAPPPGSVEVNYTYAGKKSVASLTVLNPVPIITSMTPTVVPSVSTSVTVIGTGFVPGSVILMNGTAVATTYVDSSHLTTTFVPSLTSTSVAISVSNPKPGGGQSSSFPWLSITVAAAQSSVRVGGSVAFSALLDGHTASGGSWAVLGGMGNGTIDASGLYQAPNQVPNPNAVQVAYVTTNATVLVPVEVLNPIPVISAVTPNVIPMSPTVVTVTGSGFLPSSQVLINSAATKTSYVDSTHLTATVTPAVNTTSTQVVVQNPDPGSVTSSPFSINQGSLQFSVTPAIVSGGTVSLTLNGTGFPSNPVVFLGGRQMTVTSSSSAVITGTGFVPPWQTGALTVTIAADAASGPLGSQTISLAVAAVPFDTAARFTTQAAFGPRPDVVQHVQQIGLDAFIKEQQSLSGIDYDPHGAAPRTQFLRAAQNGNSLLRLRVALAFQSFIVGQGIFCQNSTIPYEELLERDAFGNFRDLLTDITQDENLARLLNLAGNNDYPWGYAPPNQNFARELMQLFTLGTNLLNEDGTLILNSQGNPVPTYTQAQVVDLSRVLTGWNWPGEVNPDYYFYGIDYSVPLAPRDDLHDHSAKTIVGNVTLPAGLDIVADRKMALDTIFAHPNLPPFISRLLIQRLVKSAPSPEYVRRIARVFEDDGTGTRGNLAAVIRAILLDPEARAGDTVAATDDGFLQEPLLQQMFTTSITQQPIWDDEPDYYNDSIGEPWWFSQTVFGSYNPEYRIPGTNINSPEFQLVNNVTLSIRSEYLWGFLTGTIPGYGPIGFGGSSWLYNNFDTVPDLVEAIDHLAFHGQMPATEKSIILAYSQQLAQQDKNTQFQSALFLALNSDSFAVAH